ncbi:MAG: DUF4294 domain-containing protein [Bacteroidaceae bacterium]|nr:DUF4294 domain-containing protein [Bacteroidaceae bacterium]MBR6855946.1 DUF4294 domain-containing protein [Bacteroidaceae bacterium]
MKRIVILLLTLVMCVPAFCAGADDDDKQQRVLVALATIIDGDTVPTFEMMEVTIYGRRIYPSARKQRKYDKLTRNVQKMYPIALEVKAILVETYLYMQTLQDDEARKEHLEKVEKGVWDQYYPIMRRCTLSQGKLLIKLIDRECNQTSYDLIKAFIGGFKAKFYQTFAALFGASLKKEYDPEHDDEDAMIEEIIWMIDNDML